MQGSDFLAYTGVELKAKAIKALAIAGVLLGLCVGSFMYGVHTSNKTHEAALASQRATIAQLRGNNAIEAGKRLGDYSKSTTLLDAAVEQAKREVHAYYAANPPSPRIVEKTKLVPVPGQQEYVYVPIGVCPNDFLNADELRLWNLGRAGHGADPNNPK